MLTYLIRRLLYAIPILIGVNLLTFSLFFVVSSPDDMARNILNDKRADRATIEAWKRAHGYDLPAFWNAKEQGAARATQTIFWQKSMRLFVFKFGVSDTDGSSIGGEVVTRMWPSLNITLPMFLFSFGINLVVAMMLAFYRGTYIDTAGLVGTVVLMSVSMLFYIIGGQFLFARFLRLFPISGYDTGLYSVKFVLLPIVIGIIAGIGSAVRFDRTVYLEEINKDYVRTARAKGLGEASVLFKHVLKNAMIPILTSVVVQIPFLIMGNLLLENFFAIPGLGSFLIDALQRQDYSTVCAMVYLGSLIYVASLVLVDISYTLVDPRVRLN